MVCSAARPALFVANTTASSVFISTIERQRRHLDVDLRDWWMELGAWSLK
jgi:hypothetical protein